MRCQCLLCTVTAQVAASNITAVNAITCDVATALPGNTGASVLQVVLASDRTVRRQKVSQPDSETPAAAALVMDQLLQTIDTSNDAVDPSPVPLSGSSSPVHQVICLYNQLDVLHVCQHTAAAYRQPGPGDASCLQTAGPRWSQLPSPLPC